MANLDSLEYAIVRDTKWEIAHSTLDEIDTKRGFEVVRIQVWEIIPRFPTSDMSLPMNQDFEVPLTEEFLERIRKKHLIASRIILCSGAVSDILCPIPCWGRINEWIDREYTKVRGDVERGFWIASFLLVPLNGKLLPISNDLTPWLAREIWEQDK